MKKNAAKNRLPKNILIDDIEEERGVILLKFTIPVRGIRITLTQWECMRSGEFSAWVLHRQIRGPKGWESAGSQQFTEGFSTACAEFARWTQVEQLALIMSA